MINPFVDDREPYLYFKLCSALLGLAKSVQITVLYSDIICKTSNSFDR